MNEQANFKGMDGSESEQTEISEYEMDKEDVAEAKRILVCY